MKTYPLPVKCYGNTYIAQDEWEKATLIDALVRGDLVSAKAFLLIAGRRRRILRNREMHDWVTKFRARQSRLFLPRQEPT